MKERFFEIEKELYYLCKMMPIKAVSEMYQPDWHTVKRLDKKNILKRIAIKNRFENLTGISIDEYAYSNWCERVKESGLKPLIKFAKTLKRWQEGVLAYFVKRVTSALSEGLNNKISSIQKRAYGFRDTGYFILKIYQQCGAI